MTAGFHNDFLQRLEALVHAFRDAPVDRATAWERADTCLNGPPDGGPRLLVSLTDHGPFYLARGVRANLPAPPPVPTVGTETVLLVDKAHGRLSRWPLMPEPDLAVQYRRYLRGESMIFGEPSRADSPARRWRTEGV